MWHWNLEQATGYSDWDIKINREELMSSKFMCFEQSRPQQAPHIAVYNVP